MKSKNIKRGNKLKNIFPQNIKEILEILEKRGAKPYLVGGCVRDIFMGSTPHDYDITSCASPDDVIVWFEKLGYKTIDQGKKFGTIGVLTDSGVVEITPYRTESEYNDMRHPEKVEFVSDIRLDLSRRDFTINAMAMNLSGELLDFFGGKQDIERRIIRCVGNPGERFREDALRILRALRFAARFGFEIEAETDAAMKECKGLLHNISKERIQSELRGTLLSKGAYEVLKNGEEIIREVIPGFTPHSFLIGTCGDFALRLFACIYKESYEKASEICSLLKLSNAESEKILSLHRIYNNQVEFDKDGQIVFNKKIKYLFCDYPTEYIFDIFDFTKSDKTLAEEFSKNGIYTQGALALGGGDIAATGMFPKNMTAKLLLQVLYAVCDGSLENSREAIFLFLKNFDISKLA